jgi:predicted  nucleic acid-binding Zn-ribbon protein
MQLHVARLCLDCNEVHDSQRCPVCGSEAFAYLSRWVPAPERRQQPRPATSPDAEIYRELVSGEPRQRKNSRLVAKSAIGLAIVAAAGWTIRRAFERRGSPPPAA